MRTYVNTSLIDAHNAQMQLEQMESVRFQRAGTMEVYGKFLLICAAGLALLMIGFGIMMWLMTPEPTPVADEYSTNYDISEVVIHNADNGEAKVQLTDSAGEALELSSTDNAAGAPSIAESLRQIQSGLSEEQEDTAGSLSQIERDVELGVSAARSLEGKTEAAESAVESPTTAAASTDASSEQTMPGDQFVVFRTHELDDDGSKVVTGLKYSPSNLAKPFQQYCYWTDVPRKTGSMRFDLGNILPDGGLIWAENEMVAQYKQFCQFLGA
jgi:hypothetical protein